MDERLLASARRGNKRAGQGDLIKHLTGKRITQRQAIKAKCYDCNGMGEQNECDIEGCALFPFSPYNALCKRSRGKTQNKGEKGVQKVLNAGSATFMDAKQPNRAL